MPTIRIHFSTEDEEERQRRFQVHKQYLRAIGQFLTGEYSSRNHTSLSGALEAQRDLAGYRRIQRRRASAPAEIAQRLEISWASHIQLRLPHFVANPYLPYTNAWAPVHAYYAVYMAMQAWFAAIDQTMMVDNHAASLRSISRDVVERRLFPLPWSVACRGVPHLGEATFAGLPSGVDWAEPVEVLSNPSLEDFWPRYCKMLATTRARRLDKAFADWKRVTSRKAMFAHEKRGVESGNWATTIFDFLFRLRVRSNYKDVRSFVMSQVDDYWHDQFLRALMRVTDATTLLLDSLVVRTLGPDLYVKAMNEFFGREEPRGPARFLRARLERLT